MIAGSLLALIAAGALSAGVAGVIVDQTARDNDGFVMTPDRAYSTNSYAFVSDTARVNLSGPDWGEVLDDIVGDVQVRSAGTRDTFVGIGPAEAVMAYLAGVRHEQLGDLGDAHGTLVGGTARPAAPVDQSFWVASVSGAGEQTLRWNVRDGDWRVVVMDAGGARGVAADLAVGAQLPALLGIGLALAGAGAVLLVLAAGILIAAVRRGSR